MYLYDLAAVPVRLGANPSSAEPEEPPSVMIGVTMAGAALGGLVGAVVGRPGIGVLVGGGLSALLAPKDRKSYENIPQIPSIPLVTSTETEA